MILNILIPNNKKYSLLFLMLTATYPALSDDIEDLPEINYELIRAESKLIFRDLINEFIAGRPHECQFDSEWSNKTISSSVANKYLDSNLYADVISPSMDISVVSVINNTIDFENAFCTEKDADNLWKELISRTQNPNQEIKDPSNDYRSAYLERYKFSMPVFNKTYSSAALVVSYEKRGFLMTKNKSHIQSSKIYDQNGMRHLDTEGSTHTLVYKKSAGKWINVYKATDSVLN